MNAYHALAASYDRLTNDVPYEAVVSFYRQILKREGLAPRTALDLACGTGSVAVLLAEAGMHVTAVDMSEQMLCIAQQKAQDMENPPYFVCQRLEKLSMPRAVDLAVCALDSINYITDPANCAEAFKRIYRSLNPGGCFIFDVNTPAKLHAMDNQIFLDEDENVFCVWRGAFDPETSILSYAMDLFQRQGEVWQRNFEVHEEYAYTTEQLMEYLRQAGFTGIEIFGDRCFEKPAEGEQRIYFKARKGVVK